jgi:hypothetical protein
MRGIIRRIVKQKKSNRPITAQVESLEQRTLMNAVYVAPWGNDAGDGSDANPWQTLQHAVASVSAGDTINLHAGNYQGNVTITQPNVTLQSAPGEQASISAPNDDESVLGTITFDKDASGGKLLNLDISGGGYYTLKLDSNWDSGDPTEYGASNITVQGSKLHDSGRDVVKVTPGCNNVSFLNDEIYNSGMRDGSNAEGIDAVNANNLLVQDSYIHDIATNGVYAKGGSQHTIIKQNRVENIGHSAIILGQSSDENWFDTNADPGYYESVDGVVKQNTIVNVEGAGVAAWAALRPRIVGNTMVNVAKSMMGGILITGQEHWTPDDVVVPSQDVTALRNTVEVFSDRPVVDVREQGLNGSLAMYDNHYFQGGKDPQFWDERNGFTGGLTAWQGAQQTDAGSTNTDPGVSV